MKEVECRKWDLVTIQIYSCGIIWTISSAIWPLEFGIKATYKCARNHTYWGLKNNWVLQPKWSSKFVREYHVLHSMLRNLMSLFIKICSLYNHIKFWPLFCTPNYSWIMVVEVVTKHSHQILLGQAHLYKNSSQEFFLESHNKLRILVVCHSS